MGLGGGQSRCSPPGAAARACEGCERKRPSARRSAGLARHCAVLHSYTPTLLEHNHTAEFVAARPPLAGRRPGRPAACAAWPARI